MSIITHLHYILYTMIGRLTCKSPLSRVRSSVPRISLRMNESLYSDRDRDSSHRPTSSGVQLYTLYAEK